jgi:hypothetical protein
MRTDVVSYFNGKRYMKRTRRGSRWTSRITFAYRGVPGEWPVVISYTVR